MTTAEILNAAADLIEAEGAWTQGWIAVSAKRRKVDPLSPLAVRWCAYGAIVRVTGSPDRMDVLHAEDAVENLVDRALVTWNDDPDRTQSEVVQALRDAAKAAS